jgi:hypothetical protein
MMKMRWMLILFVIPVILMAANPGDVVINEVMWMGTSVTSDEWIELLNTTGSVVDLTGWYILDDVTTTYSLSGTIPANGYFLIEKREEATDVASDLIVSTISLANTGDQLELFDASDVSIDLLSTASGWYAGTNGTTPEDYSMERIDPAGPDAASNWGTNDGITRNGNDVNGWPLNATPKAQNSVYSTGGGDVTPPEVVTAYSMGADRVDVVFSEAVDATSAEEPSNYDLYPAVGVSAAAIDGTDPALVHLTTGTMAIGTEYTLTITGIADLAGNVMPMDAEALFYGNITPVSMVKADLSRGDFVPDLIGSRVTIHGIVTSGDYVFQPGNADFYVQDATGGVDCFQYTIIPGTVEGDEVIVSGVIDQYRGKTELAGPNLAVETLSTGNPVSPLDHICTVNYAINHGEELEGWYGGIQHVTKVSGTWPALNSNANIVITDDGGMSQIVLYIDRDTDVDGSPEPEWPVDIAGIFSQYDASTPPDSGYELIPRGLCDFYPNGSLPVELVSFEATGGDRQVQLNWTTASETNNSHFYLLRSISEEPSSFARISQNIAATNNANGASYQYVDRDVTANVTYYYKLVDVDINGYETVNQIVAEATPYFMVNPVEITEYALYANYPNPFNPSTNIVFDLPEAAPVTLVVYDVLGREVVTLVDQNQTAGRHMVTFDASDLASGIYFYMIKSNDFRAMKKMVLVK